MENLPIKVKDTILKYSEILENDKSYKVCKEFKQELNLLGYDFEYYLDALTHPISVNPLIV